MKVIGRMIKLVGMVICFIQMEIIIQGNGGMIKQTGLGFSNRKMAQGTKVFGEMINSMEKGKSIG